MGQHQPTAESPVSAGSCPDPTALLPNQSRSSWESPEQAASPATTVAVPFEGTLLDAPAGRPGFEPLNLTPRVTFPTPPSWPAPHLSGAVVRNRENSERPGFVLIEHPGPWTGSVADALPARSGAVMSAFTAGTGVPVLLGHRADRPGRTTDITVLVCVPDNEGLAVRRSLPGVDAVADVDWVAVLAAARACQIPDGWAEADPVTAVDVTSGMLQVERLLACLVRHDPDNVWVTSAIGKVPGVGVLALPSGLLYASVSPDDGTDLLESMWQSRVLLPRLVGRSHLPVADQVAELVLRRHLGGDYEDAVVLGGSDREQIAVVAEEDGGPAVITRVTSTWTVHPTLVSDPVLARMMPDLSAQPILTWRVVVDEETRGEDDREASLTVVEVAMVDVAAPGVQEWDGIHRAAPAPTGLPDPSVVSALHPLPCGRVLDLGSGTGRHSLWLAEHGWDVTAVDFSRTGLTMMVDAAAQRGLRIRAELADIRLWTPPSRLFDVVLAVDVGIPDLVSTASRWVAPGGRLVIVGERGGHCQLDRVELAARATGARLRVLRASEVTRTDEAGHRVELTVVIAQRPR